MHERQRGGFAARSGTRPAPGWLGLGPTERMLAPIPGCPLGLVTGLAGGGGRAGQEPVRTGTGCASTGLAAKKAFTPPSTTPNG